MSNPSRARATHAQGIVYRATVTRRDGHGSAFEETKTENRLRHPKARRGEPFAILKLSDPETDVALGETRGRNMRSRCQCSMCPAIHVNSRSWLRSSSTHEPSDPPLRVFFSLTVAALGPGKRIREATTKTARAESESYNFSHTRDTSRGAVREDSLNLAQLEQLPKRLACRRHDTRAVVPRYPSHLDKYRYRIHF